MRAYCLRNLLLFFLLVGLGPAGCGQDSTSPDSEQGDASTPNAPGDCGCETDSCGGAGLCLCTAGQAVCICDPGHGGASCQSCQPGFQEVDGHCRAQLEAVRQEAKGSHCEAGGVAIDSGVDRDGNGSLDLSEVQQTQYVCNAAPQALPPGDPKSPNTPDAGTPDVSRQDSGSPNVESCTGDQCCTPTLCNLGGACVDAAGLAQCICSTGYTGDRCQTCAPGYVSGTEDNTCKLAERLSLTETEPRGSQCASGGQRTVTGLDLDGDGVLSPAEVEQTAYDCLPSRIVAGPVTVSHQAELNNLRGVTEVRGDLTINAPYIQDLAALDGLAAVIGSLTITGCADLQNIDGLAALETIKGALTISDNDALTSLSGLASLTAIESALTITDNDALTTLDGLAALSRVGGAFTLQDNRVLTDITGLAALDVVLGAFRIERNAGLVDFTGLSALSTVGAELYVRENAALQDVDGLSNLSDSGSLTITHLPALLNLDGLSQLRTVRGNLIVAHNAMLPALDGFPALEHIDGVLGISFNSALETLSAFPELETAGSLYISDNAALRSVTGFGRLTEIRSWCHPILRTPFTGGFVEPEFVDAFPFLSSSETRDWPGYTGLQSYSVLSFAAHRELYPDPLFQQGRTVSCEPMRSEIRIRNNASLTSFSGLEQVTETSPGRLDIELHSNAQLATVAPIGSQLELRALRVVDNGKLTDLPSGIADVQGTVQIAGNAALTTLDGLSATRLTTLDIRDNSQLSSIAIAGLQEAGTLKVDGNASLTTLQGLFGSGSALGTAVTIRNNAMLTHLGDLPYVSLERLTVSDNAALSDLSGFPPNLTTLSSLTIHENPELQTLTGLKPSISVLSIRDNPELPTCLATAYRDLAPAVSGTSNISGNNAAAACPP